MGLFIEGGEEFCKFAFEVWGEDAFADGVVDFLHSPEPAVVHFNRVVVERGARGDGAESVHKFAFAAALENILEKRDRRESGERQFFARFTQQGLLYGFAKVDVSAHGGIPFAWLDVLVHRAFLQVQPALIVENVQVHHRV